MNYLLPVAHFTDLSAAANNHQCLTCVVGEIKYLVKPGVLSYLMVILRVVPSSQRPVIAD